MKKRWAFLLAVVMLLTALPLGGMTVSAAQKGDNLLLAGDFEVSYAKDWTYFQNSGLYGDSLHGYNSALLQGSGDWGALMNQSVAVTIGKTYHLEFWYKVMQNGFNWYLAQGGGTGLYETRWETATEWTYVSYDFVAASEYVTLVFCGSGNGLAEKAMVDDVVLCQVFNEGEEDYAYNGSFEQGDLSGWTGYQSTHVCTTAADAGSYGAHLEGNGGWGALLEQSFSVKKGVQYTVTFRYKVLQNGFNAQIYGGNSGTALVAAWYTETDWAVGSLTFVADDAVARLNFCGGGNGVAENAYIDEVRIAIGPQTTIDNLLNDGYRCWRKYGNTIWSSEAAYQDREGVRLSGDGGWGALLDRAIATIPGADYTLTFWYKANENGFNLHIKNLADGTTLQTGWYDAAEWTQVTVHFTAPANSILLNFCGSGIGTKDEAYLGAVTLTTDAQPSAPVAQVKNGDFETGSSLGWAVYQGTMISTLAANEGNYGAYLKGYGTWGALLEQGFFTELGARYTLSFRYKVLSNGFNLTVGGLTSNWYTEKEWTEVTIDFTATSFATRMNICGGGNGIYESAYLDNVVLTKKEEPTLTPEFGGNSISEDVSGLAFKFTMAVNGLAIDSRYTADYTNATVDGYKLVMMGAVLSNNGGETHLDDVDGKHIVNAPALKVTQVTEDEATYFIRIINIPTYAFDSAVTARPYYIYEDADGHQTVIYGEEYSQSYNGVSIV